MTPPSGLRRIAGVLAAVALLATACGTETTPGTGSPSAGSQSPTSPGPAQSSPPGLRGLDVSSLIGNWYVTGDGVEPGLMATVDAGEFRVWQKCGAAFAQWRASTSGLFAAGVSGWSGPCGDRPDLPWLDTATGWQPDGDGIVLVAGDGSTLARLAPGATPKADKNTLGSLADPPVVTDEIRAILNASPSMGSGTTSSATRSMLVGSWVAVRPSPSPSSALGSPAEAPGFTLRDDGTWRGTDGCNGSGGRWNADPEGRIIASSGPSTLVGCNSINAPGWLGAALLAGFDGDNVLVLFDYQGVELGRLTRA
jgi:hypothetical protein